MSGKQRVKVGDIVTTKASFSGGRVDDTFWRVIKQSNMEDKVTTESGGLFTLESITSGRTCEALGIYLTAWNIRHNTEAHSEYNKFLAERNELKDELDKAVELLENTRKFMDRLPHDWFSEHRYINIESFLSKHKEATK